MPSHKLQHYVPRCLLRRFSQYEGGHAIDLFNFRTGRVIRKAPIKGQCARDYMYDRDGRLEEILAEVEGVFSKLATRIADGQRLDAGGVASLRLFLSLQLHRTDSAMKRLAAQRSEFFDILGERHPELQGGLTDREIIRDSLMSVGTVYDHTADLSFLIIENDSEQSFICSDSPVVIYNRFHTTRLRNGNYGVGSAGVMLMLAISSRHAVAFYDRDVYKIDRDHNQKVKIEDVETIKLINHMIFSFASANVYFDGSIAEDDLILARDQTARFREQFSNKIVLLAPTERVGVFRVASPEEFRVVQGGMINQQQHFPIFDKRLSFVRPRNTPRFVDTHSMQGLVRRARQDFL